MIASNGTSEPEFVENPTKNPYLALGHELNYSNKLEFSQGKKDKFLHFGA